MVQNSWPSLYLVPLSGHNNQMFFMILHVVCNAAWAMMARQLRTSEPVFSYVVSLAYMTSFFISLLAMQGSKFDWEWQVVLFGMINGIQLQLAMFSLYYLIEMGGMAIAFTVVRLSIVIPTVGSILIWGDAPNAVQMLGILLILISIPLIGRDVTKAGNTLGMSYSRVIMIGTIVLVGIGSLAGKSFSSMKVYSDTSEYLVLLLFGASLTGLLTWPFMAKLSFTSHKLALNPRALRCFFTDTRQGVMPIWAYVLVMGSLQYVHNLGLMEALDLVSGAILFPLIAATYLLIITLADWLIWKKRFGKHAAIGMLVAAAGIVAVNF